MSFLNFLGARGDPLVKKICQKFVTEGQSHIISISHCLLSPKIAFKMIYRHFSLGGVEQAPSQIGLNVAQNGSIQNLLVSSLSTMTVLIISTL